MKRYCVYILPNGMPSTSSMENKVGEVVYWNDLFEDGDDYSFVELCIASSSVINAIKSYRERTGFTIKVSVTKLKEQTNSESIDDVSKNVKNYFETGKW